MLGAFEITLPSGLLTKLDQASRRGGYLGTLLMGLTFSLTSFACVGPFVGSLLVSSVQSKGPQPVLGMVDLRHWPGLAVLLSGGVSVVPEEAAEKRRMAGARESRDGIRAAGDDVQVPAAISIRCCNPASLTRDRFLAAWFVLFAMAGLYLLGLLRLEGIEAGERLGIGRLLTACGFLIFAFRLLPGMFGGRLGVLDAYVPAPAESGGPDGSAASGRVCVDEEPVSRGAGSGPRREQAGAGELHRLRLHQLPMDGREHVPEAGDRGSDEGPGAGGVVHRRHGRGFRSKREVGVDRFKVEAMPYYALLDANENVVAILGDRATDPREFLAFLKKRPGA